MEQENKQDQQENYTWLRWLVTIIAVLVAVIRIVYPNLSLDAVSLGLIVLALAPWLSPIIKSIEITGIGKIELQELKSQVQQLQGAVVSANLKADLATATVAQKDESKSDSLPRQKLSELAKRYVETRKALKASPERTSMMSRIFSEMVLQAVNIDNLDVDELLRDSDAGNRLSAYAYLYAKPSVEKMDTILNSVIVEAKPFNQYWGIQVIRKTISQMYPREVSREIAEKLKRLLKTLEPSTDRYYETKNIIDNLAD
ncbi:MAG: hypothetical protein ACOYYU_06860 [Chloroflexota bacterium]